MFAARYLRIYVVTCVVQCVSLLRADRQHVGLWFERSPEPIVAPPGDEVIFECSLNVGSERVLWKHNSEMLPSEDQSSTRLVKVTDERQAGDYQCIAWYGASALASTIGKLTLAELKPFPLASSRSFTVTTGNNVAIDCPAPVSYPPAIIQYYFNGVRLPESSTILMTTNTLVLRNVNTSHSGQYKCSATNYILNQVFNSLQVTTLTVVNSHQPSPPKFLYTPQALYVAPNGTNVSMECMGVGSPPPSVLWRRVGGSLPKERSHTGVVGTLRLVNLQPSDTGQYVCEVSNGQHPSATHHITLTVQEPPVVTRAPNNSVVEEGGDVALECEVRGNPSPNITWLLNGDLLSNDSQTRIRGNRLTLKGVQKKHAGLLQCMATNVLGSAYGAAMLQVSPTQVTANSLLDPEQQESSEGVSPLPPIPNPGRNHPKKDHTRKGKRRRKDKKHKGSAVMVPPSRPNITRLSDKSVMVRWSVPANNGLPIQFFKVQYRELGGRGRWMTSNEDIPSHVCSYQVDNLDTDHVYKFRIAAVYSNNDNKLGLNSERFLLKKGTTNNRVSQLPPSLTHTQALSSSAIRIEWQYLNSVMAPVEGFYVYYRMTSSAGDYVKATVEGENTRAFNITHLLPDTAYDIKIQAFTVGAASDFSAILTHKTLKDPNATSTQTVPLDTGSKREEPVNHRLYVVIGAVVGGLALLTTVMAAVCFCKQRSPQPDNTGEVEDCDKVGREEPGLTIEQIDPLSMNGCYPHNLNGKLPHNGYTPHAINITSNPLAENKNVMEMSYMTNQNNNCSAESSSREETTWRGRASGENYV